MANLIQTDCVILIGTQMTSNFCTNVLMRTIENNTLIIEINPEPVLEVGNVMKLIGDSEELVPILCSELKNKFLNSQNFNYFD